MFVATYRTLETKELQISFIRPTREPDEAVKAKRVALIKEIVYRHVLSAQVQANASKLIGRQFVLQQDNDPECTAKANK